MIPTAEDIKKALIDCHGETVYKKLQKAKVAVCGLGGLGSNVAISLVRAGVGELHLIDFDVVDITNLNRQQYFVNQIGLYKTEALADTLQKISPYCKLNTHSLKIDEENIIEILREDDIVVEAFDEAGEKAMLVNGVLENFPDKPIISGSGMAGLESVNLIKTKKIGKRLYICGDEKSDMETLGSLFSPRVMACASHEAMMAIRLIIGETSP